MGRAVTIRKLHRWAGLLFTLPMILQGVTGSIIAIDPVYERLTAPRIDRPADHPDDIDAVVALAHTAAPDLLLSRYRAAVDGPVIVDFGSQNAHTVEVTVDPVAGRVLSARPESGRLHAWIRRFHENLLLPEFGGRPVVGWFGVGLLFLAITGIWQWWPRAGRFAAALTVSRRSRGWLLQRQLHGAGGAYVGVILLVQATTGLTLGFPQTARALFGLPTATRPQAGPRAGGERGQNPPAHRAAQPDAAALVNAAIAAVPGGIFTDLRIASPPRPTTVFLALPDRPVPVAVQFSGTGIVIATRDPDREGAAGKTLAWMRAIHYGEVLAPAWSVLLFAGGLGLPLLSVTGVLMWFKRRRNRQAVARRASLAAGPTATAGE